jgi:hypothetical protein
LELGGLMYAERLSRMQGEGITPSTMKAFEILKERRRNAGLTETMDA